MGEVGTGNLATGGHQGGAAEYRRLCPIATGGMATVDVVVRREGSFTRLYAMKRLLPHLRADPQVQAMFLDEARYAGLIRHANVVSVLDVGEDGQGPYLLMEYVEGVTLSALMRRQMANSASVPLQICLRIVSQIAEGLHAAHELCDSAGRMLHLVHRDVSPQNVIIGFDGVARVTDFGIAKATGQSSRTATGVLKGKVGYMSPEQLRFEEPDRRSDLFAVGVILYELLAGRQLYGDRNEALGARRILTEPTPDIGDERPETPAAIVELLFELLTKEPANRPRTAREVSRRIDGSLAELVVREDGPIDLAEYTERHFGDERRARAAELATLLEQIEPIAPALSLPTAPSISTRARGLRHSGRVRLVAGAVVAISGTVGAWYAGARSSTRSSPVPVAEPTPKAEARASLEVSPPSVDVTAPSAEPATTSSSPALPPPAAPKKRSPPPHKERGFKRFE